MSMVEDYLKELRDAFSYLSNDRGTNFFTYYSVIPWIMLVFVTAISSTYMVSLISIIISLILVVLKCKSDRSFKLSIILKPLSIVMLIAFVSSLPLLLKSPLSDIRKIYLFILRVTSSTLIFIAGIQALGWLNIARGMSIVEIPEELINSMFKTIKFIPIFINETLRMLIARSARIIGGHISLKGLWFILAGIITDLIVKAHYKAIKMNLAITARTLGSSLPSIARKSPGERRRLPNIYDYIIFSGLIIAILVELLVRI